MHNDAGDYQISQRKTFSVLQIIKAYTEMYKRFAPYFKSIHELINIT